MQAVDFTARPKSAAAGIFTQIEPVVCNPRKTHRDASKFSQWYILTSAFPLCEITARWLLRIHVHVVAWRRKWFREHKKAGEVLHQQNGRQRKCLHFCQGSSKEAFDRGLWYRRYHFLSFLFFKQGNSCKLCTINVMILKQETDRHKIKDPNALKCN